IALQLLTLCIFCASAFTKVQAAVPLPVASLDPDVEILPSGSAVSSQYVYRVHNKPIIRPVVAPIVEVNPPALAAPLNNLAFPAAHTNLPLTAPVLRPPIIPIAQQAAPLLPLPPSLSPPTVFPATLISHPTRVYGPPAFPHAPARLTLPLAISQRLRSRFSYKRRPSAIALRRYPTHAAYRWYG
ncbi:uncharacterized protein LOC128921765, partial [Zeugodacus cucurbitae]|uniref:uncharacterized protein LOC128921765 n=1 Tax=Zeugodacus cucurbitae TaxID=28588 RepID=UPI0023D96C14